MRLVFHVVAIQIWCRVFLQPRYAPALRPPLSTLSATQPKKSPNAKSLAPYTPKKMAVTSDSEAMFANECPFYISQRSQVVV